MNASRPYRFARPSNAGLASEPRAVGRRIAKVLDALETLNHVLEPDPNAGTLEDAAREFGYEIRERLRAEGWRIKVDARDRWQVLPPKAPARMTPDERERLDHGREYCNDNGHPIGAVEV